MHRTAIAEGLSVRAVEADLSSYEISGPFDSVSAIGILMFFERARALALLGAVMRAVRPGGVAVVNTLIEGTTFRAMFDPERHYLFGPTELERAFSDWAVLESRVDRFPAPGDSTKVFSTIVARRPPAE